MHYFLLGDDAFTLKPWLLKPYSKRQHIWNPSEQIQGPTGNNGAKAKVVRDILLTCIVLHDMLKIHQGGGASESTPQDEVAAIVNGPVVYVADENAGIPRGRRIYVVRPTQGFLQPHWCIGWAGGQDLRCDKDLPLGQKKLASISPFHDYPIIPRTFI